MAVGSTTRFGLTTWSSGDDPWGRAQFNNDNLAVENLGAVFRSDTTANRPSAALASSARSFYYSTTDSVLYFADGTNWKPLNSLGVSGDASAIVAGTVTTPEGVAERIARADHKHTVTTASAGAITGTNGAGVSTSLARADHDHSIAANAVGATQLAANSVTRAKIDATAIVKATTGMLSFDTTNGFAVNINASFFETVSNAISIKASAITTTELAGNIGKAKLATDIVKTNAGLAFDTTNGLSVKFPATSPRLGVNASGELIIVTGSVTTAELAGNIGRALLATDVVSATGGLAFTTLAGLSVNTSTTVGLSSNTLIVNTNSINATHLTVGVAGSGLTGGNGTALSVVLDNTTIGLTGNALRVVPDSIGAAQVDATIYNRFTTSFVASSANVYISTAAPTGGAAGDIWFRF
jgi:hypothetical protein